jgi:hypothetical protein
MKIQLDEHGGCFSIYLEAETMGEAAALTRMGVNHTRDLRYVGASAYDTGKFCFQLTLGKHRRSDSNIPRRK